MRCRAGRNRRKLLRRYRIAGSVSGYYDIPVGIRSVDLRAYALQGVQGLLGWMAVVVARAYLYDADSGLNFGQEGRSGS